MINNINPNFVFPATLLIGGGSLLDKGLKAIASTLGHSQIPNPDCLLLSPDTEWGIAAVRQITNFFSQKTYRHPSRLVIVSQADMLEIPAQNALLKTAESPGENCYLILTASQSHRLLPTILSRCHIINLNPTLPGDPTLPQLKSLADIDRFLASSPNVKNYLQQLFTLTHIQFLTTPSPVLSQKLSTLIYCLSLIDHRVDPKLALDYYVLKTFPA